jgi:hypothetical protein
LNRPADTEALAEFVPLLLGGDITDQQLQEQILGSAEYFGIVGDDNASFVSAVFQTLLNRPASQQDLNLYESELNDGVTRLQVVASILGSPEYETDQVDGWIQGFLDRAPQPDDLSFVSELQNSVTDENVIAQIVGSPEFFNLAQETSSQSAPEPDTFLALALGLGLMTASARRTWRYWFERRIDTV